MQQAKESKKSYHAPQIKNCGTIQDLTATNTVGGGSDGGSFPNLYAS